VQTLGTSIARRAAMLIQKAIRRLHGAPILLALALTGACSSGNAGGSGGGAGGSGGGAGSTETTTQTSPANEISAIAWREANEGGSSAGDGGTEPGMLYLKLADYALACPESIESRCLVPGEWWAYIGIPPALQTPGTYPLSSSGIVSDSAESGSGSDDCCYCGGGSLAGGTLEIVSIDAATLVVRLSGLDGFRVDGERSAEICP
jgi:hypothetical protein